MSEYHWSIEYICKLTRGQLVLFMNKIGKRKKYEQDFHKSIHGIQPENKGLDISNAIPIEDIVDGKQMI